MASRVREFNNIRQKRLSQTSSQLYFSSRITECQPYRTTKQTTKNMNKKEPICLDCVNHKLISHKKQKIEKEKGQQIQSEQQFEKIKVNQEKLREMRTQMLKQASLYNYKLAEQIKRRGELERKQVQTIMNSSNLDLQQVNNESDIQQQHKKKIQHYRRELQQQYKQQKIKKSLIKKQRLATHLEQSLIKDHDTTQVLKKYEQQLKKQIRQNQIRNQQLKKVQKQLDHQALTNFDKDFIKFSEFTQKNNQYNPEFFEEMKKRQVQKKVKKVEDREKKQRERKQQLMKAKKQAQLAAQNSLSSIKSYANILETQIAAKKRQYQLSKKMQYSATLPQLLNEQPKQKINKKSCGQCCKTVNQMLLSYY